MTCPRCNEQHLYRDVEGWLRDQVTHELHICADQIHRSAA